MKKKKPILWIQLPSSIKQRENYKGQIQESRHRILTIIQVHSKIEKQWNYPIQVKSAKELAASMEPRRWTFTSWSSNHSRIQVEETNHNSRKKLNLSNLKDLRNLLLSRILNNWKMGGRIVLMVMNFRQPKGRRMKLLNNCTRIFFHLLWAKRNQ